jgi:hypothetical protein
MTLALSQSVFNCLTFWDHKGYLEGTQIRGIVEVEIQLRIGQCHDALKAIQLALGKKGFLFRTQIRPKGPKTGKTRPWDSIHAVHQMIWLQAQIYCSTREALDALQALQDVMDRLQVLDHSHLKTSTTLLDPSQSGWKHA